MGDKLMQREAVKWGRGVWRNGNSVRAWESVCGYTYACAGERENEQERGRWGEDRERERECEREGWREAVREREVCIPVARADRQTETDRRT